MKILINIANFYFNESLTNSKSNSKDGPTLGQFGKNVDKVQKHGIFMNNVQMLKIRVIF